jgi:hypothetical protein
MGIIVVRSCGCIIGAVVDVVVGVVVGVVVYSCWQPRDVFMGVTSSVAMWGITIGLAASMSLT